MFIFSVLILRIKQENKKIQQIRYAFKLFILIMLTVKRKKKNYLLLCFEFVFCFMDFGDGRQIVVVILSLKFNDPII